MVPARLLRKTFCHLLTAYPSPSGRSSPSLPSMPIAISPSRLWYSLQNSLATEASGPGGRPLAPCARGRGPRAGGPPLGPRPRGAHPAEPDVLRLGEGPGELLPHQGVAGLAALARRL